MNNDKKIVSDIAEIIKDYKYLPDFLDRSSHDDLCSHVEKWIDQFLFEDRSFVLNHTKKILSERYFSESKYDSQLQSIVKNKKNHHHFRKDCLLSVQARGGSQNDINLKLNSLIKKEINIEMPIIHSEWSGVDVSGFNYVNYVDDFSFSAKLVGDDIISFITENGIDNTKIRILILLAHTYGYFYLRRRLNEFIGENKLNIEFVFNRRYWGDVNNDIATSYSWRSETYFLQESTYNEVIHEYHLEEDDKYKTSVFRVDSHENCILGDNGERNRIEKIFTQKGLDIISCSDSPKASMKPLGFSVFKGFGFGGNVFSYRNCPNNTPLVFWWGAYEKTNKKEFDCWYPLMKRHGYYV